MKKMYHVFADNFDDWTKSLVKANKMFDLLKKYGHENIRIYEEEVNGNEEVINENCIKSIGSFPL